MMRVNLCRAKRMGQRCMSVVLAFYLSAQLFASSDLQSESPTASTVINISTNTPFQESFLKSYPNAVSEGLLLDGGLMLLLHLAGAAPATLLPYYTFAAILGYTARKTCKLFFYGEGASSIACGFVGNAIKYGGRSLMMGSMQMPYLGLTALRGAINGGLYEYYSEDFQAYGKANEQTKIYALLAGIETVDGILDAAVSAYVGDTSLLKIEQSMKLSNRIKGQVRTQQIAAEFTKRNIANLFAKVKEGIYVGASLGMLINSTFAFYDPAIRAMVTFGSKEEKSVVLANTNMTVYSNSTADKEL